MTDFPWLAVAYLLLAIAVMVLGYRVLKLEKRMDERR